MDSVVAKKLVEIISEYGLEICKNKKRMDALLKDLCPSYKKEIFVLVSAIDENIPEQILAMSDNTMIDVATKALSQKLCDNLSFSHEVAEWSVTAWMTALKKGNSHGAVSHQSNDFYSSIIQTPPKKSSAEKCLNILPNRYYVEDNIIIYSDKNGRLYSAKGDGDNVCSLTNFKSRFLARYADNVFYTDESNDGKMYRVNMYNRDTQILSDCRTNQAYVSDGWIYYISYGEKDTFSLYRVRADGGYITRLAISAGQRPLIIKNVCIVENFIYVLIEQYGHDIRNLYKIKEDGSKCKEIYKGSDIEIANDSVYYINRFVGDQQLKGMRFYDEISYKTLADGDVLAEDATKIISVHDNWIYYKNLRDSQYSDIYKIKTNGTGKTFLNSVKASCMFLRDPYILYENEIDNNKIYTMRLDGTDNKRLCEDNINFCFVDRDYIYCINNSDNKCIYALKPSENLKIKLTSSPSSDVKLSDRYIYYRNNIDNFLYRIAGCRSAKSLNISQIFKSKFPMFRAKTHENFSYQD